MEMRRTAIPLLAAALALTGCQRGIRIAGAPAAPIAVGAKYRFAVVDACDQPGLGLLVLSPHVPLILVTPPTCLRTEVDRIVDASFSDPAVFQMRATNVDAGAALFEIEALQAGTARFEIRIATRKGDEYMAAATFRAEDVTRVALYGECTSWPDGSDELVPVGRTIAYRPDLMSSRSGSLAGFGYYPFDTGGLPFTINEENRRLVVTVPEQPGEFAITSPADPSFRKVIRVFDESGFTSLELVPAAPVIEQVEDDTRVQAIARVGNEYSCFDAFPRRIWTDTPAACGLHGQTGTPRPQTVGSQLTSPDGRFIFVRGLQLGGACQLRGEVIGTSLGVTLELPVREGWTTHPIPGEVRFFAGFSAGPSELYLVGGHNAGTGSAPNYTVAIASFDGTNWTMAAPEAPANATGQGRLEAIWGTSGVLFAVGQQGTILRRVGTGAWEFMAAPTGEHLRSVWGASATDVWAVGDGGTILHYDGVSWQPGASGTTSALRGVWVASGGEAYAVGDAGTVLRFDGAAWSRVDLSGVSLTDGQTGNDLIYRSVWGTGPDNVYLGATSALLRKEAGAWRVDRKGTILGIWGSGPEDVYTAGAYGDVYRFDGQSWRARTIASAITDAVWGFGTAEVYVLSGRQLYRYR
jgi:hypothetical protein